MFHRGLTSNKDDVSVPSRVSGSHAREVCGKWAFRFIQALANHIRASTTFGNSETRDNELRRWEVRDLCARVLRPGCGQTDASCRDDV